MKIICKVVVEPQKKIHPSLVNVEIIFILSDTSFLHAWSNSVVTRGSLLKNNTKLPRDGVCNKRMQGNQVFRTVSPSLIRFGGKYLWHEVAEGLLGYYFAYPTFVECFSNRNHPTTRNPNSTMLLSIPTEYPDLLVSFEGEPEISLESTIAAYLSSYQHPALNYQFWMAPLPKL